MNKVHFLSVLVITVLLAYSCNSANKSEETKAAVAEQANTETIGTKETVNDTPAVKFNIEQIMQAALDGNFKIIEGALNNGFDVNTIDPNKRTMLMLAAFNGHTQIVEFLIAQGSDVNMLDRINRSALMFASTGPFVPTVKALLQAGAKPNLTDDEQNWTAAMMAASEGQLDVLKVLAANGADLTMVDVDGESPLYFAKQNGHIEVAKYIESQLN